MGRISDYLGRIQAKFRNPWEPVEAPNGEIGWLWRSFWAEVLYYVTQEGVVREQLKGSPPFTIRKKHKVYPLGSYWYVIYLRMFDDLSKGVYKPEKWYQENP